jgi:hypothetical protein
LSLVVVVLDVRDGRGVHHPSTRYFPAHELAAQQLVASGQVRKPQLMRGLRQRDFYGVFHGVAILPSLGLNDKRPNPVLRNPAPLGMDCTSATSRWSTFLIYIHTARTWEIPRSEKPRPATTDGGGWGASPLGRFSRMTTPETQRQWLAHDLAEFRRLLDEHPQVLETLADVRDAERHTLLHIVAELYWRIWAHATAVGLLLNEQLFPSALVLSRAIFEALVTLGYLVKHRDSQNEAVILRAFSYQRDLKHFAHQANLVEEYTKVLAIMPEHLVEVAKERARKHPKTWSGKNVREMALAAGVNGYDPGYAVMSGEAHASAAGRYIRLDVDGRMMSIEASTAGTEKENEALANMARRALHTAFLTMWDLFKGPKITIRSESPDEWLKKQQSDSSKP